MFVENVVAILKERTESNEAKQQALKEFMCPDHNEIMNLVCLQDNTLICAGCKLFGHHSTHAVSKLLHVYEQRKESFAKQMKSLLDKHEANKQCIEGLVGQKQDLLSSSKDIEAFLKKLGDSLIWEIQMKVRHMVMRVHTECSMRCRCLQDGMDELSAPQKVHAEMKKHVDASKSPVDFLKGERRLHREAEKTTAPFCQLLKKDEPWTWTAACSDAVHSLKSQLTTAPVLAHFYPICPTIVIRDTSAEALGAVLSQLQNSSERPVAFASRVLSSTEQRPSQRYCRHQELATSHFSSTDGPTASDMGKKGKSDKAHRVKKPIIQVSDWVEASAVAQNGIILVGPLAGPSTTGARNLHVEQWITLARQPPQKSPCPSRNTNAHKTDIQARDTTRAPRLCGLPKGQNHKRGWLKNGQ
eukprot:XP_014023940.1 PREDICTED: uncharacterized protein LOC106583848 [Salmo salar]